ncbi:MAG: hypothetical protein K9N47_25565 [Prosthecobacter sp.]|uniref:hypothetical protein n=1 Tax=Prosthecobacter sp. TaxID=1965333 RepID=UPI00261498D0|nr:hypothetical protein [Prosthecobacter sp.]MCF7789517.1 hypothetical protein [Prosthecobacter sp.]
MNKSLRATRLLAGVTPSSAPQSGLLKQGASLAQVQPRRSQTRRTAVRRADETSLWIEEPLRFHRARYEHLTRILRGKFSQVSAVLTCLILFVLGWRAASGEYVSPERWLCGLLSGWFIVSMARLALFTCLAAPRGVCYAQGRLRISGLGILRAEQILHWSIQRGVRISAHAKPGARLQICCRWCGCARHWTMLMEEGQETERLERLLEMHLPRTSHAGNIPPLHRTIQIEDGILSQ